MDRSIRPRLVDLEIGDLSDMLRDGRTTSVELTQAYLDRIDRYNGPFETFDANGGYNAFVRVDREGALAQAREVDELLAAGVPLPPLAGIPIGIKDSIAIEGRLSSNGFAFPESDGTSVPRVRAAFEGNIARQDAEVVAKLRKQKAVILGHTTCSERSGNILGLFAGNAWDMRFACGGSSQGSGVAPVARLAVAAIGVETGGSIVIPAAANGASAIKPAPGAVPAAGIMQGQAGMDVPGPMARSVRDAALLLNAMYDGHSNPTGPDSAVSPAPSVPVAPSPIIRPLSGLRIGIPLHDWMFVDGVVIKDPPYTTYEPEHRAAFDRFRQQLELLGADVVEFDSMEGLGDFTSVIGTVPGRPDFPLLPSTVLYMYNAVMKRQAEDQLAFAGSRASEQADLLKRFYPMDLIIEIASLIDTRLRALAARARHRLRRDFQQALDDAGVDFMLVLPLGARVRSRFHSNYLPVRRSDHALPNMLGWSMVTFPIGTTTGTVGPGGGIPPLPITAAFWGPASAESLMIQAGIDFQGYFPEYHTAVPPDPTSQAMEQSVRPPGVPRVWPAGPREVDGTNAG